MSHTTQFVCPGAPKKNRANMKSRQINLDSSACRNLESEFNTVPTQKKTRKERRAERRAERVFAKNDTNQQKLKNTVGEMVSFLNSLDESVCPAGFGQVKTECPAGFGSYSSTFPGNFYVSSCPYVVPEKTVDVEQNKNNKKDSDKPEKKKSFKKFVKELHALCEKYLEE